MQKSSSKEILKKLKKLYDKLENEKLSSDDLDQMVSLSQNLHERCVILRYKAIEEKVFQAKKEAQKEVSDKIEAETMETAPEIDFGIFESAPAAVEEVIEDLETSLEQEVEEIVEDLPFTASAPSEEAPVDSEEPTTANSEPAKSSSDNSTWTALFNQWTSERNNAVSKTIQSLPNSFGLNERLLYSNQLFDHEVESFTAFVNELESQHDWSAAAERIANEATTRNWDENSNALKEFVHHIKRRYA